MKSVWIPAIVCALITALLSYFTIQARLETLIGKAIEANLAERGIAIAQAEDVPEPSGNVIRIA